MRLASPFHLSLLSSKINFTLDIPREVISPGIARASTLVSHRNINQKKEKRPGQRYVLIASLRISY